MKNFGLTLSEELEDLDLNNIDLDSQSRGKPFNYFQYPSMKTKEKPFSTFDYSLDGSMNIVMDEPPLQNNKYDEIIDRQEKLIDLLKDQNNALKDKIKQLENVETQQSNNFDPRLQQAYQEILPVCYLLNVDINSQFLYGDIYQSVENVMAQLVNTQNRVKELEKKVKETGMQRVNSTTYLEKSYARDNRGKRGTIQYREKQEPSNAEKLQKEVQSLRQQCNRLRSAATPTPIFVPSIKEKKIEVVIEKVVEKIVQKVVEKVVQVPVQKIVYVEKFVDKIIQKPVYFEKKVKQQVLVYIDKIVEKVTPIYIDRQIQVQKIVYIKSGSQQQLKSKYTQTQS